MKFALSCLAWACPTLVYGFSILPNPSAFFNLTNIPEVKPLVSVEPRFCVKTQRRLLEPLDVLKVIHEASKKHRVPPALVKSIVAAESNFDCDALSPKGAIGLMQLMPATALEYGADPSIPEQNIDAGTRYLRVLLDKYRRHGNALTRTIAAYNAGPGMVDRYHGVPPFRETRKYVLRVMGFLRHFQKEQGIKDGFVTEARALVGPRIPD